MFSDEYEGSPSIRTFIKILPVILLGLSILSFLEDYKNFFGFVGSIFLYALGWDLPPITAETTASIILIAFNLFLGASIFFIAWLLLVSSQALLPVNGLVDTCYTALHLLIYILGFHGPAIKARDGNIISTPEELKLPYPGVAIIDFNSAMILEKVFFHPGCLTAFATACIDFCWWLLGLFGMKRKEMPLVRVCGPGLTFIDFDERIQGAGDLDSSSISVENISGVVDLRRQFRISRRQSESHPQKIRTSVRGYTRDGIELNTNIFALFTIGQDPNLAPFVLQVAYQGSPAPENLRVIAVSEDKTGKTRRVKITSFSDELDPDDREEIHQKIQSELSVTSYSEIPQGHREPTYDPGRVFSAVYSRARSLGAEEKIIPWTDLPVHVAIDFFREILSSVNFDELYQRDTAQTMKVNTLRRNLRMRMRNNGLLSFRFVCHRSFLPLFENVSYSQSDIWVSPVTPLTTPKTLRDRGIQMIFSGFGDPMPEEHVYKQWLASWRAGWERDTMTSTAIADLEVMRIQNRARIQAQEDMSINLKEIFKTEKYSREAIAIRLLQALESIAADRETRQLLPEETLSMLRSIHSWLIPEDMMMFSGGPPNPPSNPPANP
ncbi:MAG: hypothetical protein KG029_00825 [Bacteroidetes bacterium]|nr:hypothetical protein [Bacteroidota bacterium]